jgi:predicted nucleic acid-binding protein
MIVFLRNLKLKRAPMKRLLDSALEIALNNTLAVYDLGYIALAMHYSYPLITIDQPQTRAAMHEGVTLISITNFTF